MQKTNQVRIARYVGITLAVLGLLALGSGILEALKLTAIAAVIALLLCPLCSIYERALPCPVAAALSLATAVTAVFLLAAVVVYPLAKSLYALIEDLPGMIGSIEGIIRPIASDFGIDISLPEAAFRNMPVSVSGAVRQFASGAADVVGVAADLAVAAVIAWYMLIDRHRLALRLELMVPCRWRSAVLKGAYEAGTELMMYLRGQSIIAACVGLLSAFGLFLTGIPNGIPLGLTAGLLNMIPYLGPFIACIPVGVVALTEGFLPFVLSVSVLIAVQQIDGLVLSPRIVGSSTGFAPAVVMTAIFASGAVWGPVGMLLALPVLIIIRTCVRVFVELLCNC